MQKLIVCSCLLLLEVIAISGLPFAYNVEGYRLRRSPRRTVMVSGYYGRPSRRSDYEPEGAMTAFVSGETVATNSYLGGRYNPESEELEEEGAGASQLGQRPLQPQPDVPEEDIPEPPTRKPKRIPKRRPQKPQPEEEEDDDEGSWPFQTGRRGPSYNAFFPIMLGGYRGVKGRDAEGYPGSATAIANSFSTGKGGVASSHATAYGDPYASTLYRNGFNVKKKPSSQQENY